MEKEKETAVLIGLVLPAQQKELVEEYLDELDFLAQTAGAQPVKRFVQKLDAPHPATFIGSGKVSEVNEYCKKTKTDIVIFDDELNPTQLRNLEKALRRKVLDRTNLILDIFSKRARTAHAKTQVELAQYQYLLPRLAGLWTHLERQRGGIGMRGPGEREIETDRRIIRDRIAHLKKRLAKIDKQMAVQRKNRGQFIRVALVGYTNVGKSTIMNRLSKSRVFAENKLFATLDTTIRKVVIDSLPFLLSDTVGFIRKLPHHLVESFKSTLDETRESDMIVHVVDISHPAFEEQIEIVENTLKELKVADKPTLMVFNKTDNFTYEAKDHDDLTPFTRRNYSLEMMKEMWMSKTEYPSVFISAKTGHNMEAFKKLLFENVRELYFERYPYNRI